MWYKFDQNNSGGRFHSDDYVGIGPVVWIEADSANVANARAEDLGIYFNGTQNYRDCPCCGSRWHEIWKDDGEETIPAFTKYDFSWYDKVFFHPLVGKFYSVSKDNATRRTK